MKKITYKPTEKETKNAKESVTALLNEYFPNHLSKADGIDIMFDSDGLFWGAKGWLIKAFKNHPEYNGNLQIVLRNQVIPGEINFDNILRFKKYIFYIWKEAMQNDNKFREECAKLIEEICETICKTQYTYVGNQIYFRYLDFIDENPEFSDIVPIHMGQKVNRYIREIAKISGITDDKDWEQNFQMLSDAISTKDVIQTVVISVNQTDFYTNSFGKGWSTYYDIDKYNRRNGNKPQNGSFKGCHCNGGQAQMLDETSFIVYTLDNYNGEENPELIPKRYMCFFNFGERKLCQSRVYPICKKYGSKKIAKFLRETVKTAISEMFGPYIWETVEEGEYEWIEYHEKLPIKRIGELAYNDYSYGDCSISYAKKKGGRKNIKPITFGVEETICPECGIVHKVEDNIFCEYCLYDFCEECGEWTKGSQCEFEEWNDGFYCDKCRKKIEALEAEYEEDDEEDW